MESPELFDNKPFIWCQIKPLLSFKSESPCCSMVQCACYCRWWWCCVCKQYLPTVYIVNIFQFLYYIFKDWRVYVLPSYCNQMCLRRYSVIFLFIKKTMGGKWFKRIIYQELSIQTTAANWMHSFCPCTAALLWYNIMMCNVSWMNVLWNAFFFCLSLSELIP